ncbi:MAG: DUF433 domain-containing protein [Scytonema sp. CRU_2_7]|nr:DUF433 domain-containing protein [Scytonema sp. CRU_2_7]
MQLEDYFNFLTPNDIRLKGSRIGIETILNEYIYQRHSPEIIAETYPSITLEEVYATILYYLHNQESVTQYMADWLKYCQESARQQDENPPEYILRLRQLKAQRGMS